MDQNNTKNNTQNNRQNNAQSVKAITVGVGFLFLIQPLVSFGYGESAYYAQGTYYGQSTYYAESTYYAQGTYNLTFTTDVTVSGTLDVSGQLTKEGGGSFVIDHPLDPENFLLYHSFVESPDVKNIYDGVATLDEDGEAVIALPDYFEALNRDYRYQVKALDTPSPNLYIKQEVTNNHFTIAGGTPEGTISWQVTGIRHDPYILANPITPVVEKGPDALVEKGEYLFEGYEQMGVWAKIKGFFSSVGEWFASLF